MKWKRWAALGAALMMTVGAARAEYRVEEALKAMTLEQKIYQLFFVTPEAAGRQSRVTEPTRAFLAQLEQHPVGGLILFSDNFVSKAQTLRLTEEVQASAKGAGYFIGTDEEGGGVSRAINKLHLQRVPAMSDVGETGDLEQAYQAGRSLGTQLAALGLNLDFAPVADVRTDVDEAEITARSFGYDAPQVADMVAACVKGLTESGVIATLKHFPGHGSAAGDSHSGKAISTRTVGQWRACEWLPFQSGLKAGAEVVLMSHLTAAVVDHASPASLSYRIVTELLRGELGFDGVVITDALRMDAVNAVYSSGEACVKALQAGVDMLLLPYNFTNAFDGVTAAVEAGELTEERIDESVRRILRLKEKHGLLFDEK